MREKSSVVRAGNWVDVFPEARNLAVAVPHNPAGGEYFVLLQTFQYCSVEFNLQGKTTTTTKTVLENFTCRLNLTLSGLDFLLQN